MTEVIIIEVLCRDGIMEIYESGRKVFKNEIGIIGDGTKFLQILLGQKIDSGLVLISQSSCVYKGRICTTYTLVKKV